MSIKAQFATTQREMLSETIRFADAIAAGETALRQATNTECRRFGDQFAAASALLDMCREAAERDADSPATVGLYRRLARDYRLLAERALMICGEFESMTRADDHVDKLRLMMHSQLTHFEIDACILFEAAIQQVDRDDRARYSACHPAG